MSNDDARAGKKRVGGLWWGLGLVVLTIVVMAFMKRPAPKAESVPGKPPAVKTQVIRAREMRDAIVLPGRVAPLGRARLSAEADGRIVELPANKGDAVKAGQALLTLDCRSAEHALRQAEIQSREAAKEMTRWEGMKEKGAVSGSDFDAIRRSRDLAAVALDQARVQVTKCEVRTPIPGVVNDRHVELGEYVHAGAPVFDIVNIDEVKIAFDVPERDVLYVAPDRDLDASVEALPGRVFTGRVAFVAAAASEDSNAFACELRVPNPGHLLRPGMVARVSMVRTVSSDALVVPLAAVVPQKGDYVVFVVEQGRAARRMVRIEAIQGSEAVISGLKDGEEAVIEGGRSLADGMPVTVTRGPG